MSRGSDDHLTEALRELAAESESDAETGDRTVNEGQNRKPAEPIAGVNVPTRTAREVRNARAGHTRNRGQTRHHHRRFKATAVPLIATVGLLLLLPAIWGTMLLAGVEVWLSERRGATTMARTMLVCWPIAIALFGSAIFYAVQLFQQRRR